MNVVEMFSTEVVFGYKSNVTGKRRDEKCCSFRQPLVVEIAPPKMLNHLKSMTRLDSHDLCFFLLALASENVETNKTSISTIKSLAFYCRRSAQCHTRVYSAKQKTKHHHRLSSD